MCMPSTDNVYFKSEKHSHKNKAFISFGKRKSNWNFIYKYGAYVRSIVGCIKLVHLHLFVCVQQLVHAEQVLVISSQHILHAK